MLTLPSILPFLRTVNYFLKHALYELMRRESTLLGEWEYLSAFRNQAVQPPPEDEAVYRSLRRRLLVEVGNGEWRLRVPLMTRWLRERG